MSPFPFTGEDPTCRAVRGVLGGEGEGAGDPILSDGRVRVMKCAACEKSLSKIYDSWVACIYEQFLTFCGGVVLCCARHGVPCSSEWKEGTADAGGPGGTQVQPPVIPSTARQGQPLPPITNRSNSTAYFRHCHPSLPPSARPHLPSPLPLRSIRLSHPLIVPSQSATFLARASD